MLENRSVNIIKKVNKVFFPFLVNLSFFFLLLESYTYIGFLAKHTGVDVRLVLVLTLVSAFFLMGDKLSVWCSLIFKINTFILPVSVILYLAMQFLEASHFHNYVYSTYHFQPSNFIYIVFLNSTLFIISRLIKEKSFVPMDSIYKSAIVIVFIIIFLDGITLTVDAAVYADMYMLTHIYASRDSKMYEKLGVYYNYIMFVKASTPENARILTPPMQCPWCSSGNLGIDRYFLFPRNMENGSFDDLIDSAKYDYVLLASCEWDCAPGGDYGWPKVPIKADKIIYFDPMTGITKEKKGNYDPGPSLLNGSWGLIKLRE